MGGSKQGTGEIVDLARLRHLLRHLLDSAIDWPDFKHLSGLPLDILALRRQGSRLDLALLRLLLELSSRVDLLIRKLGMTTEQLDLEASLRAAFRRARGRKLDRKTVERAVAEQLKSVYGDRKR
jgi:hypothetical protein